MTYFLLMKMFHRGDDFAHVIGGSTLTESFALNNFVKKFPACRKFHDNMYIPEVNIASVEFDDVWVVEASENF